LISVDKAVGFQINQLHRAVAAGGDQLLAVVGELGGQNPIGVGLEIEQLFAGRQIDAVNDLVCSAKGNRFSVGCEADAVEFIGTDVKSLGGFSGGHVPYLHLPELGRRSPARGQLLSIQREREAFKARAFTKEAGKEFGPIGLMKKNLVISGDGQN